MAATSSMPGVLPSSALASYGSPACFSSGAREPLFLASEIFHLISYCASSVVEVMCEVRYDSVKIWLRKKVGYSLKNIVFEADVPCKSTRYVVRN